MNIYLEKKMMPTTLVEDITFYSEWKKSCYKLLIISNISDSKVV